MRIKKQKKPVRFRLARIKVRVNYTFGYRIICVYNNKIYNITSEKTHVFAKNTIKYFLIREKFEKKRRTRYKK